MKLAFRKESENPQLPTPRVHTPDERKLLVQFASCEIGLEDLLAGLDGMIAFEFTPSVRFLNSHFLVSEPGIRIDLHTIHNAIASHENGEMSARELQLWATMIRLNDAYVWDGPDEEQIVDKLDELSMPQIFKSSDR